MSAAARYFAWFGTPLPVILSMFVCLLGLFGAEGEDRQRRVSYRDDVSSTTHQQLGANEGTYAAGNDYPDFSPVGALLSEGGWMGTATLISPGCIVTAAHVVWDNDSDPEPNPADWEFIMGTDFEAADAQKFPIASIQVHPGWLASMDVKRYHDGDLFGFDLALLQLGASVPDVPPAEINAKYEEALGEILYFAGLGSLGNGIDGVTFADNSNRFAGANLLDRVNSDVSHGLTEYSGAKGGVLGFDFDSPSGDKNSLNGDVSYGRLGDGTSEAIPISLEATSVTGDSGGPAFSWVSDAWRLVGVSSYGTTNSIYGDVAVYTRVANHADWIRSYLEPWPTVPWSGTGSWRTSSWFGSFLVTSVGKWIYHEKHGWLYAPDGGDDLDNLWLWSKGLGWTWINREIYPYLYSATSKSWLYFWDSYSTRGNRFFYDFSTDSLLLKE